MFGLGVAGMAVASALHKRGETVILADDEFTKEHGDFARTLNCEFVDMTDEKTAVKILQRINRLAPAPGISESHHVITMAGRVQCSASRVPMAKQQQR